MSLNTSSHSTAETDTRSPALEHSADLQRPVNRHTSKAHNCEVESKFLPDSLIIQAVTREEWLSDDTRWPGPGIRRWRS
jgi:hypothetical protein